MGRERRKMALSPSEKQRFCLWVEEPGAVQICEPEEEKMKKHELNVLLLCVHMSQILLIWHLFQKMSLALSVR